MTENLGPAVEPIAGDAGGPWTSHGWAIEGLTTGSGAPPQEDCGGPGECDECTTEAAMLRRRYLEDEAR
jgi:hypothetical protein